MGAITSLSIERALVPTPKSGGSWASSAGVRRSMQSNRSRDTRPEIELRSQLHKAGLRFRKHYRPIKGSRCEVDIAFTHWGVAIQLDGCFWHGCPQHATRPATNGEWWAAKLDGNVKRDRRTDETLSQAGWTVVRFWEHEPTEEVVFKIRELITNRKHAADRGLQLLRVRGRG